MTEWAWVALGYGVTAIAFASYAVVLVRATRRVHLRRGER